MKNPLYPKAHEKGEELFDAVADLRNKTWPLYNFTGGEPWSPMWQPSVQNQVPGII